MKSRKRVIYLEFDIAFCDIKYSGLHLRSQIVTLNLWRQISSHGGAPYIQEIIIEGLRDLRVEINSS